MKPAGTPPPAEANDEVAALIATLHRTGQRLEELTAGEVDAVADQDGRTFLLQGAQERLRHSGAAKQAAITESLRVSESRFRQMAENISDVFFLRDVDGRQVYYVSPAYERIWGRTCASLYADPASWADSIHPDDRNLAYAKFNEGRSAGFDSEFRIVRPDGGMCWVQVRGFPIADDAGNTYRMAGVASDITHRKQAEIRIAYLNRVYAMLSGINTLIVRVRGRDELFREACRMAVGIGGFRLAWIGIVDRGTMHLKPVAWEGAAQDYLEQMPLSLNEADQDQFGLAGQAVRDRKPVMVADMEHDPRILLRREARERGFHSLVMLPLVVSDAVVGVLALYANEIDFFNEGEMKLLTELAGDIAFAIDHIGKQERLDYLAYYDVLTGLANRGLFLERVAQYMRSATRDGHRLALFLIDLERFKNINDSLGQSAGDALLRQVAQWLIHDAGGANLVARLGADHFAVVLPDVKQEGDVARTVEKSMAALRGHPFRLNDAVLRISARIGIALFPDDGGASADSLLKNAEAALKKAKAGGDRYLFYTQQMTEAAAGKVALENRLREALARDEFVLHYQPQKSLVSGKLTGAEALIRWNDPRAGLVQPGRFIPILEETGMIGEVGRWAMGQAVADYLRWLDAGLPAVRVAVNVSPLQLRGRDFVAEVKQALGADPRAAAGLELEITENLIMQDVEQAMTTLRAVRGLGVTIAIDDFGTGFSSLSYLSRLPVDTLKIDRSFVSAMTTAEGRSLVPAIIGLAHSLQLKVVAEGVETEEQSRLLRLLSCDEMQGYLLGRPVPCEVFEASFLRSGAPAR